MAEAGPEDYNRALFGLSFAQVTKLGTIWIVIGVNRGDKTVAKDDNLDFDDLELPDEPSESESLEDLSFPDEQLEEEGTPPPEEGIVSPDDEAALLEGDDVAALDGEAGFPAEEDLDAGEEEEAPEEIEEAAVGKKSKKKRKKSKVKKPKPEKEEGGPGFLEKILSANVYTVMLAVSLLAMIVAVVLLFAELNRYNRDIPATELKEKMGAALPVQSHSPSTTAIA